MRKTAENPQLSDVQASLFELQDLKYRDFHAKLMPTVDKDAIIGVRTPRLRKLAEAFFRTAESCEFLKVLPHDYYEETNLHGFLIEKIKDYDTCIEAVDAFLPYVDNWATCDLMTPKVFKNHLQELSEKIKEWMHSEHTYTIRVGVGMRMRFYLDHHFETEYLDMVADLRSDEYYVNMMIAWFFATALAKQYDATLTYMEQHR